jgi:hypothetical protein
MNADINGGNTVPGNPSEGGGGRRRSLWKGPAFITVALLSIPLLRSLFVDGWDWDVRVFLLVGGVGTLLFSMGLTCQMVIRNLGTPVYRAGVAVAMVAEFLLVWGNFVQAADDVNRAAMMYLSVPLVGIIAAALARFRPDGMARAMFVTALAQALVLAIVLMIRDPHATPWTAPVLRGFVGNALNGMLFVGSALLFRKAARGDAAPAAV